MITLEKLLLTRVTYILTPRGYNLKDFLLTAKVQIKRFVAIKNVCPGLFIDKTCVHGFLSESLLNTDTLIILKFWHAPLVSMLWGSTVQINYFVFTDNLTSVNAF